MVFERDELSLTDAEFRMFRDFFRSYCGLHFGEDSRFLLEKRLARRVRELDLGSFSAYHYLLRKPGQGDQELGHAIDALTTNETYFFRERSQLQSLVEEIIPDSLERRRKLGGRALSIWSAGCSSGEEPYSIVMMAKEAGLEPGKDFRVYASDISGAVLRKARHGLYRPASFRESPDHLQKKYFEEHEGLWRISDEIKRHVVFTRVNLLDRSRADLLGSMDVVLCRNVIIYFDLETKRDVVGRFHDKLQPGGYLLLGHAESLINVSSAFTLTHLKRDMVYRRPLPGEELLDPWHAAARAAISPFEREEA
ncbi:MAG: protein-glutamate O-methyltransferase CheR [Deltaproteobacteria bacterium]|nr:protein-glutamate O-methyltransferase CheR [Deltaproteobacteria bacterium]MBW2392986.1 protein-glutamate O-methyltransferase CheR [Deltaproteobacteria bacterium]